MKASLLRKLGFACGLTASLQRATGTLIATGLAMLMQPWSLDAFSWGFPVLLAGVVGYSIAGKLPAGD